MAKATSATSKTGKSVKTTATRVSAAKTAAPVHPLNVLLADHVVLYTKLRKFHWNVTGPQFAALHMVFEQIYDAVALQIDEIAEFIRQQGPVAIGTLSEFQQHARLTENPGVNPEAMAMVAELASDFDQVIAWIKAAMDEADDADDEATEDVLLGLLRAHMKTAWMLRAVIEK